MVDSIRAILEEEEQADGQKDTEKIWVPFFTCFLLAFLQSYGVKWRVKNVVRTDRKN